jgi:hypothetical protein
MRYGATKEMARSDSALAHGVGQIVSSANVRVPVSTRDLLCLQVSHYFPQKNALEKKGDIINILPLRIPLPYLLVLKDSTAFRIDLGGPCP